MTVSNVYSLPTTTHSGYYCNQLWVIVAQVSTLEAMHTHIAISASMTEGWNITSSHAIAVW